MGAGLNLILFEPEELKPDGTAVLQGRRAQHIASVHRAAPGDVLRVGVIGGRIGVGTVRSVSESEVAIEVTLLDSPPPDPGIDLIVAIARPKVARRILSTAASLGVRRLVLLNARNVEPSYFDSPVLEPDAIRAELIRGLEQGRDTNLPHVMIRRSFKAFIEDEMESLWPVPVSRIAPDPGARQSIRALTLSERCVIVIGPEAAG